MGNPFPGHGGGFPACHLGGVCVYWDKSDPAPLKVFPFDNSIYLFVPSIGKPYAVKTSFSSVGRAQDGSGPVTVSEMDWLYSILTASRESYEKPGPGPGPSDPGTSYQVECIMQDIFYSGSTVNGANLSFDYTIPKLGPATEDRWYEIRVLEWLNLNTADRYDDCRAEGAQLNGSMEATAAVGASVFGSWTDNNQGEVRVTVEITSPPQELESRPLHHGHREQIENKLKGKPRY